MLDGALAVPPRQVGLSETDPGLLRVGVFLEDSPEDFLRPFRLAAAAKGCTRY